MLFLLFFLQLTFLFLSNVAALNITCQSNTIVGLPSLMLWAREPSDGNGLLVFDLRFVKSDNEDGGLALANIMVQPSIEFGTEQVVYRSPGSYRLVAVSCPGNTWIGQSTQVNAFQVPTSTSIPASTFHPVPSASSSAKPPSTFATSSAKPTSTSSTSATSSAKPTSTSSTSSETRRKKNVGAIVGGTLGGVAFLGLLAALGVVFFRRRRQPTEDRRRWTFQRDKMILPPILDIRRTTPLIADFLTPDDIERQVGLPYDDNKIPVVMAPSPTSASLKSPTRPLPLIPPVPLKPHQEDMVVQMEKIRNQIKELEKNPGPAQHIILDDLQKQLNWFKSQFENKSSLS